MEPQEISLEHESLEEFRQKLSFAIGHTARSMIKRGMTEGTVTAKIRILMSERTTPEGEILHPVKLEPKISTKIDAKGEFECDKKEDLVMTADGTLMENQISMFGAKGA